ncbi:MAG: hypothetical protein WAU61_13780 [Smithella sp.]
MFIMFLNFLFSGLFLSLKEFLFQGKHAVIEKPHVWKLFENIQMQDAQKTNRRVYLLCALQHCLQRNSADERLIKAFRLLPAGSIFNHGCAFPA